MRVLPATLAALLFVFSSSIAWSQTADPFGASSGQPADPFAPQPATRPAKPQKTAPPKSVRAAVLQKAKQALAEGRKPQPPQARMHNEAEQRINAVLNDETSITFIQTPLQEAMQTLSAQHNIPIVIDLRALEEIGLDDEVGVTIDLKNVTLRAALRLTLRDLELTYLIKDEVMQITTVEAAEDNLILAMYVLPDNLAAKADQVIKVMTATVVPDIWESLGGPSTAMAIDHVLVISTTSDVQHRAEKFLTMLIEKYGK
ncbi:hypothetical protein Enr13x_17640 [Stieleria neptunia]|uniref:NolW-like domain-containing protein n=1 Tax=Stieleria neptunia TaxID=2527979 RepID=A0A518HM37_9BACT|nr:hypothetical protein [Stieleria neptunia]QDV41921.1 hypothetical protein Enr13x_17640 [Stieleria neptunia]